MLSFLLAVAIAAPSSARENPRAELLKLSPKIKHMGPGTFLHGFRRPGALQEFELLIEQGHFPSASLVPLLRDPNARVRSLAMVGLYTVEGHKALPRIVSLIGDTAETFPRLVDTAVSTRDFTPEELLKKQTVGELANAIVSRYLSEGGHHYGANGWGPRHPGFVDYWNRRRERKHCAGWFAVELAKACHATSPTQQDRIPAIKRVRSQIDIVPEPDRTLILIWLTKDFGSDALVSKDELVRLAKKLGPDVLMGVLRRKPPTDDPDLQPRSNNNFAYAHMCGFILQHADDLLRPKDASSLLQQELWERDYQSHGITDPLISPLWAIAAAQLNTDNAGEILNQAYTRFQGKFDGSQRLMLARARWEIVGKPDLPTTMNWYYTELGKENWETWAMSRALKELAATDGRTLIKTIILDPRFDTLNWKSLEETVRIVNSYLPEPAITEDEMSNTRSPNGIDFFYSSKEQAMKSHPVETKALLKQLARWRRILRSRIKDI